MGGEELTGGAWASVRLVVDLSGGFSSTDMVHVSDAE